MQFLVVSDPSNHIVLSNYIVPLYSVNTMQKRPPSVLSLKELVADTRKKRKSEKLIVSSVSADGWVMIDKIRDAFDFQALDKNNSFALLDFSPFDSQADIFCRLYPQLLVESIVQRVQDTSPTLFTYGSGKSISLSMQKIYKFLAIKIRVQGLHAVPQKNEHNVKAQRKAFQLAREYFAFKFPASTPVGINFIEQMHNTLIITPAEDNLLSDILLSSIVTLGQWTAGDEKLFHFTGRSALVRKVPNKPAKIGIWSYELTVRLSNDKSYLIYVHCQNANSNVGESIPPHYIIKDWGQIVKKKGQEKTMLVADSYYLDASGKALLEEMNVKYVCSVQKQRFHKLVQVVQPSVTQPGQWDAMWNDTDKTLFVYFWDMREEVGKKYLLTNAFKKEAGKKLKYSVPGYDEYNHMFSTCDYFNKDLHDCSFPHKKGGKNRKGDLAQLNDFYFTSILMNIRNAWGSFHNDLPDFKSFCESLADQLYDKASNMSDL